MDRPLVLALVTDTHVRPDHDDGQRAFPSDAGHNDRNRVAAGVVRGWSPDAIVHLGDVVHPIPTLPTHREALANAKAIWASLGAPLLVVPGNHDVGDKRASAAAPVQVEEGRQAFRDTWGEPFRSVDVGGVHLAIVDGALLLADTPEAEAQRAWLEADLGADHARTFVFTHYPPFLCDPGEPEHYDNLGEPGRGWFLDLLARHRVEALFTGHVHRFFYNRYQGVDLYTVPGLAFVRPEYAALRPVPPEDAENGRDDREHLGVTRLVIRPGGGHHLEIVRPLSRDPSPPSPRRRLGVWLRHRLGRRAELPYGDLDALTRKVARDDASLLHVLALGLGRVRIPLADLDDPDVRDRVAWLGRAGVALTVFSAGLPTPAQAARVGPGVEWEIVCRPADLPRLGEALAGWDGPRLTLGRIGRPFDADGSGYFSHFPREGFDPRDPALDALPPAIARVAFRVADGAPIGPQVAAAVARAEALGLGATCHVELPWGTEATRQTDDALVAARVVEADAAAEACPAAHVLLDLLVDKDRGYWPRNGLVDAADRPRAAWLALKGAR